jgi:SulP family sulfate permease
VTHRIPGPLVALVVATLGAALLGLPVETIGDRYGAVPNMLPTPSIPSIDLEHARELVPAAVSIAILGAIESLLSCVIADGMIGTRHRSDAELVAQGVANLASPLFGGIPATGALARTATNVKSGGRTPIAGIVHAVALLAILAALAPLAARIPLAALAGILVVVAWHMADWRVFAHLLRSPRSDIAVLVATFATTVIVDIVAALQLGIVLASLLFMRRIAQLSGGQYVRNMVLDEGEGPAESNGKLEIPDGVEVFEVQGALFFGAASAFGDAIRHIERTPVVLIVRLAKVLAIDATGLRALQDLLDKARHDGTTVLLSGVHSQPLIALERAGLIERIGEDNLLDDFSAALERARQLAADAHRDRRGR